MKGEMASRKSIYFLKLHQQSCLYSHVCLYVNLSVHPSACLSACLSKYQSVCTSIRLSVCPYGNIDIRDIHENNMEKCLDIVRTSCLFYI